MQRDNPAELSAKLAHALAVDPSLIVRRVADVESRPVTWLWKNVIPRGKITIIAGDPGLGKSQITASIASVVTTAAHWPVNRAAADRGRVLMLSAEDDVSDTIRPRLEAAGADLGLVEVIEAVRVPDLRGGESRRGFDLVRDAARLDQLIADRGDVVAVVVDPAAAYLAETDTHRNADVRAALLPLAELAARRGVAVLIVAHLNKGQSAKALNRVSGSLAFVAAARAGFLVASDPENPKRRLFVAMKNNLGPDQVGFAFHIEPVTVDTPHGAAETSRVVWESEPVAITADAALESDIERDERTERDDAKAFLRDLLAEGPVGSKQVRADADGAGYAWATVRRAAKELGVQCEKTGMRAGWVWRLQAEGAQQDAKVPMLITRASSAPREHLHDSVAEGEDE